MSASVRGALLARPRNAANRPMNIEIMRHEARDAGAFKSKIVTLKTAPIHA
jgi:hypothetical protein